MPGVFYMILCLLVGKELAEHYLFQFSIERKRQGTGNFCWVFYPAAFGVGTLAVTWLTYGVSWMAEALFAAERPLLYGNFVVMLLLAAVLAVLYWSRWKKGLFPLESVFSPHSETKDRTGTLIADGDMFRRETFFFTILTVFLTWIMFYVFHMKNGVLYSGFTVYGDYAPHTAMMRSFSLGNNFPTQYPHFGGEDVKYHFMFQFLAGNLEYLGIRIDFAYNLISVLALLGFLMMLYGLAVRITGKRAAGVGSVVLFFFRSGLTFFRFILEHIQAGDLWKVLQDNTSFIGYTPNENWGLWNFNVYLNQRHLAFGLVIVCTAIWVYLDWVEAGDAHLEKGLKWMRGRLFTREAWVCRDAGQALAVGILLGLCSFWNGAAVIGGLLILMGFGIFSDGKLDYALTALAAVVFALLQSKIFMKEGNMALSFQWGFLAADKSLPGVLWYLLQISGVVFLGLIILAFFVKRRERVIMAGFFIPTVFAFCFSLTPDINVNHKYLMIAYAFLTIFWAWAVVMIWKKGIVAKPVALVLAVSLTATGIYDFVVILKDNDEMHRVGVSMESSLTDWLVENLDSSDLILTPEYSMNEVTMAGVMLYCGWPYYAWSAGYDTYYRAGIATEIYTTPDAKTLKSLTEQEGITYILFQEGMTFEEQECREDVISEVYPLVFTSDDGRIRIYEV